MLSRTLSDDFTFSENKNLITEFFKNTFFERTCNDEIRDYVIVEVMLAKILVKVVFK